MTTTALPGPLARLAFGRPVALDIGALGLIAFLVITTAYFHDFWNLVDPERKTQMVQFMKNLGLGGGLLLLVADGAGRYSLDRLIWGRAGGRPPTAARRA